MFKVLDGNVIYATDCNVPDDIQNVTHAHIYLRTTRTDASLSVQKKTLQLQTRQSRSNRLLVVVLGVKFLLVVCKAVLEDSFAGVLDHFEQECNVVYAK